MSSFSLIFAKPPGYLGNIRTFFLNISCFLLINSEITLYQRARILLIKTSSWQIINQRREDNYHCVPRKFIKSSRVRTSSSPFIHIYICIYYIMKYFFILFSKLWNTFLLRWKFCARSNSLRLNFPSIITLQYYTKKIEKERIRAFQEKRNFLFPRKIFFVQGTIAFQ